MLKLLDKTIIFMCCSIFFVAANLSYYAIVPIVIAIIISGLISLLDNPPLTIAGYIIFLILCIFLPNLLFFIPLICYDLFCETYKYVSVICLPIIIFSINDFSVLSLASLLVTASLVYLLKVRNIALASAKKDYFELRDKSQETTSKLNILNKDLLEKQEYEINTATLNERNRIAREIHDTVGHLLSSSILQIGALLAVTKDEQTKESLTNIKETLSIGMDSIRSSIHNIHEESINLEYKLQELVKNFDFCDIVLKYKVSTDFSVKAKYSILFIVKECLANVIKHSNATHVSIIITELPAFYQIVISDNGSNIQLNTRSRGMGVSSIMERINSLGGSSNINTNNGYKLFISLPKQ